MNLSIAHRYCIVSSEQEGEAMKGKKRHPLAAYQDKIGVPSKASIERCIKYGRKLTYFGLVLQTIGRAVTVLLSLTLTFTFAFYMFWFQFWFLSALERRPLFDVILISGFWNFPFSTHLSIVTCVFVFVVILHESARQWDVTLRFRAQVRD